MSEHSFTIYEIEGYIESIYLVESDKSLLLLDGGCRGDAKRIEAFITGELHRPVTDIGLMVVSHMHPDHAGGAPILRKKFGIPIAAHHKIDNWYKGWRGWLQNRVDRQLARFSARRNGKKRERVAYPRRLNPDYPLHEGDHLPGFPDWAVMMFPGHTAFDIGLFNNSASVFYAGDLVLHINGKFMLPFPVPFPDRMKKSLARFAELNADTLLLAHGGRLSGIDYPKLVQCLIGEIGNPANAIFRRLKPFTEIGPEVRKARRKRTIDKNS
ncbi:MAG: MBL fold metallo-hydrolase [Acidobacteria bacterium]|nr:MBL fold metallo-hydrolase [Acidobacteriota bacterium]